MCCGDNGAEDVNLCKIYPKGVVICENAAKLSALAAGIGAILFYGEWGSGGNLIARQTPIGCNVSTWILGLAILLIWLGNYAAMQAFVLFYMPEEEQTVLYSLQFSALVTLEVICILAAVNNN